MQQIDPKCIHKHTSNLIVPQKLVHLTMIIVHRTLKMKSIASLKVWIPNMRSLREPEKRGKLSVMKVQMGQLLTVVRSTGQNQLLV